WGACRPRPRRRPTTSPPRPRESGRASARGWRWESCPHQDVTARESGPPGWARRMGGPGKPGPGKGGKASLLRRLEDLAALGFDGLGLLLAELDDVVDELLVVEAVGGLAVQVDLAVALARAAAGEAEIGLARLPRAVHHAADDRKRHRRGDVLQPVLQRAHRLDHVEALPRAGRARDDVHAAMAQVHALVVVE